MAYTPEERRADGVVHVIGIAFAVAAAGWLVARLGGARPVAEAAALGFYAVALIGVLAVSAAYHLASGPLKDRLRRVDHAMIFVMIAATYMPFVLLRLPGPVALPLGLLIGGGCLLGGVLKLTLPGRLERLSIGLYLMMGWSALWAVPTMLESLAATTFTLIVAGGALYTGGVAFFVLERLRFHNALWHACVLAGAITHFAAVAVEFA
ncbi:PAQR family membrane homeostasis protein TrhA [Novispirillum sp. DQ9]|uniref:PAQR family membrane homeostasis protein TrhA n=1 Tax=Novispirillum sp. DQ9 TaxID=3398612 RepID=UPI003C7A3CCF